MTSPDTSSTIAEPLRQPSSDESWFIQLIILLFCTILCIGISIVLFAFQINDETSVAFQLMKLGLYCATCGAFGALLPYWRAKNRPHILEMA